MAFGSGEKEKFYEGLRALSEKSFPKKCGNCGRVFPTLEDFIERTESVPAGSGLKESLDEKKKTIVEFYRNCVCGSTLMALFSDRRDPSEGGRQRRETFGALLRALKKEGLSTEQAREELLKVMRGEPSPTLGNLGVAFKSFKQKSP